MGLIEFIVNLATPKNRQAKNLQLLKNKNV